MEEQLRRRREQTNVGSKVAEATSATTISVQDLRGTVGIFAAATLVQASLAGGARGSIARIIVAIQRLKVVGADGVDAHFPVVCLVSLLAGGNAALDAPLGAVGACIDDVE